MASMIQRSAGRRSALTAAPGETMRAPLPVNEAARLKALHAYDILDTPPEQAFDDLARLASQICATPIAMVSLIDGNRQWFKARVGTEVTETPRDIALCSHT